MRPVQNGRPSPVLDTPRFFSRNMSKEDDTGSKNNIIHDSSSEIDIIHIFSAFQPFFVSYTLPYAAVRGEKLPLKVSTKWVGSVRLCSGQVR